MKQRCSSRVAKRTKFAGGTRKPCGESHAAAQEGELHKKSDDARAGGAECTGSMDHDAAELQQRARATIGVGKETCYSSFREIYAMPVYPRGLAFV